MNPSRRKFLQQSGLSGVGLLSFGIAGCERQMTPAGARSAQIPLKVLTPAETRTLESLGNIVVPGSSDAGLVHYIDHQLAASAADCMLMIKYLGVNAPFTPFYRGGIAALEHAAAESGSTFSELSGNDATALVGSMASNETGPWSGPPAALFFFVIRSDAVDVRYGTPEGFADLGIPYMPHIAPPDNWGA